METDFPNEQRPRNRLREGWQEDLFRRTRSPQPDASLNGNVFTETSEKLRKLLDEFWYGK